MIRRVARKAKRMIKRVLRIGNYQNIDIFRQWIDEIEPTVWSQGELAYVPLISVVVPVYNVSSQMLRDCIDSVRAQTYEKLGIDTGGRSFFLGQCPAGAVRV